MDLKSEHIRKNLINFFKKKYVTWVNKNEWLMKYYWEYKFVFVKNRNRPEKQKTPSMGNGRNKPKKGAVLARCNTISLIWFCVSIANYCELSQCYILWFMSTINQLLIKNGSKVTSEGCKLQLHSVMEVTPLIIS